MESLGTVGWYSREGRRRLRPEGGSRQTPREERRKQNTEEEGKEGRKDWGGKKGGEGRSQVHREWRSGFAAAVGRAGRPGLSPERPTVTGAPVLA